MKFKFQNSDIDNREDNGPRYWKSLDDLVGAPEFNEWLHREFPQGASEAEGVNRRHFLKIMAASFAFAGAGMAGCRRPEQNILPYSKQPENVIPGVPVYFSSSLPQAKDNIPLVVESHQNRPTKIEGNELYTPYGGGTNIFAQASVLDLYDPDRARQSSKGKQKLTRAQVNDLLSSIHDKFGSTSGQGLAFLAEQSTSPTRARLVAALKKKFPRAVWAEYEPASYDNPEIATERLFGKRLRPQYKLPWAQRILSLDADFLGSEPGHLKYARDFATTRRVDSAEDAHKMSRLYQAESNFSITGSMADHRLRVASAQIPALAALIAAEVLKHDGSDSALEAQLRQKAEGVEVDPHWVEECVKDLWKYKGHALVVAGSQAPVEVHQLVFFINDLLGAVGRTVNYLEIEDSGAASIAELVEAMNGGRVETLFVLGGNPAYNTPAGVNWSAARSKVNEVVRFGYYNDETASDADYHIAATHYLESWGDGRTYDGTVVPVQPLILPLFDCVQELELLARLAGMETVDTYALVSETVGKVAGDKSGKAFQRFLSDGLLEDSGYSKATVKMDRSGVRKAASSEVLAAKKTAAQSLEVRIVPDSKVWDGRYNNNGWLQECPEPMTKITWDNAINISPRLAKEIGYDPTTPRSPVANAVDALKVSAKQDNEFKMGREVAPIARLTLNGATIEGPVHVQPGLANYTVVVPMGYGRTKVGRVGKGTGFSVFPLMAEASAGSVVGAKLELTGETHLVANTQQHWSMEGRAIIREANVDQYVESVEEFAEEHHGEHGSFVDKMGVESHSPPIYGAAKDDSLQSKVLNQPRGNSLYKTPDFTGDQQWGMSIDLNTCTGCNACVVACQSENNIPIVGKDQVTRGREMHWIRLDRYYSSGDTNSNKHEIPEDPQVSLQPMLCQHCEMAPCEQVCPVNATVHDDQGLNVMAYNRCVGTRYCSNNCPYKVRRFNFFDWNKRDTEHFYEGPLGPAGMPELHKMQKNPDVTVRMRGVMEKCTFCQQRIEEAKIDAKVAARDSGNVKVADGVIKTACQQVCPTDSIVFGDVADPDTQVSRLKENDRDYAVLGYLNVRPRTTYLARLRNPNPHMPDYYDMPLSRAEYEKKYGHGAHHGESSHNGNGDHDGHGETH